MLLADPRQLRFKSGEACRCIVKGMEGTCGKLELSSRFKGEGTNVSRHANDGFSIHHRMREVVLERLQQALRSERAVVGDLASVVMGQRMLCERAALRCPSATSHVFLS